MKQFVKNFFLIFLLCSSLWAQGSFRVSGIVHKPPQNLRVLFKKLDLLKNVPTVLDTINLKRGKFNKTYHFEPGIYQVDFQGVSKVNFAVEHGQVIAISVDFRPSKSNPVIDLMGSFDAEYVFQYDVLRKKTYDDLVKPVQKKIKQYQISGDLDSMAIMTEIENIKLAEYQKVLADFAKRYFKNSIANFYAAIRMHPDRDLEFMKQKSEWFNNNRPGLSLTKQLAQKVERFQRIALGQQAPEFELPTLDNKKVYLKDFRGSYVLIDFWASWCLPCRQENLNYARQYQKYADSIFRFLSISIDTNKKLWAQASQKDGIKWTNVSDLQGWNSEVVKSYDVTAIPANFLIDPEGKIIAKDLRGLGLNKKLAEILD